MAELSDPTLRHKRNTIGSASVIIAACVYDLKIEKLSTLGISIDGMSTSVVLTLFAAFMIYNCCAYYMLVERDKRIARNDDIFPPYKAFRADLRLPKLKSASEKAASGFTGNQAFGPNKIEEDLSTCIRLLKNIEEGSKTAYPIDSELSEKSINISKQIKKVLHDLEIQLDEYVHSTRSEIWMRARYLVNWLRHYFFLLLLPGLTTLIAVAFFVLTDFGSEWPNWIVNQGGITELQE